jgi:hypothetical protein
MFLSAPLPDAVQFIDELSQVGAHESRNVPKLTRLQKSFLAFCISAMVILASFCWERMSRGSCGTRGARSLGWMLHHSKIPWAQLWNASVIRMVSICGAKGVLVIDDTDRLRAKGTKTLFGVHKVRDKKTAGYSMAQNLVILVFVTKYLTFPVGFAFFRPDPAWKTWREKDIELRKQGVKKSERPKKPPRSPAHPMRTDLSIELVRSSRSLSQK